MCYGHIWAQPKRSPRVAVVARTCDMHIAGRGHQRQRSVSIPDRAPRRENGHVPKRVLVLARAQHCAVERFDFFDVLGQRCGAANVPAEVIE